MYDESIAKQVIEFHFFHFDETCSQSMFQPIDFFIVIK